MTRDKEEMIACRTPEGKSAGTNMAAWKFHLLRDALRQVLGPAGPEGMLNKDVRPAVEPLIAPGDLERLGKLGWHLIGVRLEMEVRGEIVRVPGKGPLRIALV